VIALRSQVRRRRALVTAAVAVVAIVAALIAIVSPFGGGGPAATSLDNASSTSLASVTRRDLSSQTQVGATLGYADATTISVPAGTAPSNLQQAQQAAASAQASLETAEAMLLDDARALALLRAKLAADTRKQAIDCSGSNAAESTSNSSAAASGGGGCASEMQAAATDRQSLTAATSKMAADRRAVTSARTALAGANEGLAAAESSASVYGQTSAYTMLPAVGRVVRRGEALYAIGGDAVVLLYGPVTPWRAFEAGMSPGRDVAELNANLRALGYGVLRGNTFTSGTAAAIKAFQAARGLPATGQLLLGSVVFASGAVRVTSVTPSRGAPVQAGPVLDITSTRRVITIALDASQQSSVKVGDPVVITLPDNSTTPGHVSYVGTVATTPSSDQGGGGSSSPTIEVDVTPDRPGATGLLDQAPVDVSITTATVRNALVVPVNALLALASGGYAVEVVTAGVHQLVAVNVGLFDGAEGLVEVTGSGLHAGQRVVVPAS